MHLNLNKFNFILLLFLLTSFYICSAQTAQPRQYVIAGVSIEGNVYADPSTVITLSGLRVGDNITIPGDVKIQQAIKNLWDRKQFSDVEIDVDKITAAGVFLVVRVKEFPRLGELVIEGNKEVSTDNIRKAVGKVRGDILSPYELYMIRQRLKKTYKDESLMFAKIETILEPTTENNFDRLRIVIHEGVEFHVASIDFEGNKQVSSSDLAGSFKDTKTKHWWEFWKSSKFDSTEYEKDKKLLENYYKSQGFRDAEILRDSIGYDEQNEVVHIKIWVNEGPKVYIRNIAFAGNTVYPTELLLNRLDFRNGDVYNYDKLQQNLRGNEDFSDALSLYLDNGYLYAQMNPDEKRIAPDSVDITINVIEGNRVKIGKVDIVGNTKTKDKVIRRELYTRPGDFFDRSAIVKSIRALGVLNYFNPETLKPDVKPIDNTRVDISYKVEERSTDSFNASLGFAGAYGLTLSLGIGLNNFSLDEPLKGGGGQVFNFNWEFGQASRLQTFSIGFTEPWLFDEPTTLGFNAYDTRLNYYINLRRTGAIVNLGRRFRWPDDYFRGDWNIGWTRLDSKDSSSYYGFGISHEALIGQTISRISLNNLFFPTSGSRFSFSTQWAMGAIGIGTVDYLKNTLKLEFVEPLMRFGDVDRLVFYLSTNWGYITGFKSDKNINPLELFRMGGNGLSGFAVTPLRGYDDQTIGPINGGKVMARHIAELRFSVTQNPMPIYVYGFAEAGNVWNSLTDTDPFNLKRAAGLGVQLMFQPFGIIGFSYGYGFDPDDRNPGIPHSGWKFLFTFGNQ